MTRSDACAVLCEGGHALKGRHGAGLLGKLRMMGTAVLVTMVCMTPGQSAAAPSYKEALDCVADFRASRLFMIRTSNVTGSASAAEVAALSQMELAAMIAASQIGEGATQSDRRRIKAIEAIAEEKRARIDQTFESEGIAKAMENIRSQVAECDRLLKEDEMYRMLNA